jgi:hypothetical protein
MDRFTTEWPTDNAIKFAEAYASYRSALSGPATSARQFVKTRMEPDPNHPADDSFMLHFPHATELVEGGDFWLNNLAELLEAYASSIRPASQWIPVEEKLPYPGDWVLVCFMKDEVVIGISHDGTWYRAIDQFELKDSMAVTHWQPLPDPPDTVRPATQDGWSAWPQDGQERYMELMRTVADEACDLQHLQQMVRRELGKK